MYLASCCTLYNNRNIVENGYFNHVRCITMNLKAAFRCWLIRCYIKRSNLLVVCSSEQYSSLRDDRQCCLHSSKQADFTPLRNAIHKMGV